MLLDEQGSSKSHIADTQGLLLNSWSWEIMPLKDMSPADVGSNIFVFLMYVSIPFFTTDLIWPVC